jgi:tetratricopeptide (TPR) repeat protein
MARAEQAQRQGDRAAVLREVTGAREAFEQALRLGNTPGMAPTFLQQWDPAKTHALLGQVLFSLGDRAGARDHLAAALRLEPAGPVADVTRQFLQKLQP